MFAPLLFYRQKFKIISPKDFGTIFLVDKKRDSIDLQAENHQPTHLFQEARKSFRLVLDCPVFCEASLGVVELTKRLNQSR